MDGTEKDRLAVEGVWEIIECSSCSGSMESDFHGVTFELTPAGDVSWEIPSHLSSECAPFFGFDSYEVMDNNQDDALFCPPDKRCIKFFGTSDGQIIELTAIARGKFLIMQYEGCCVLRCQKLLTDALHPDAPFDLLGIFNDELSCDMSLVSSEGIQMHVHKLILYLASPGYNWFSINGLLPYSALKVVVHFAYSESLPSSISEADASAVIKVLRKMPNFASLCSACEGYIRSHSMKQQLLSIAEALEACLSRMLANFTVSGGQSPADEYPNLFSIPSRVVHILKLLIREFATAVVTFCWFCDMFVKHKKDLTNDEKHDLMAHCLKLAPDLLRKFQLLIEHVSRETRNLTEQQRSELAAYLVPELEHCFDTSSNIMAEAKLLMDYVIRGILPPDSTSKSDAESVTSKRRHRGVGSKFGLNLRYALHMKELIYLNTLQERIGEELISLIMQRNKFIRMNANEKERVILKYIRLIGEAGNRSDDNPHDVTGVLDQWIERLNKEVSWRSWKYGFKFLTTKIVYALNKVRSVDPPALLHMSIRRITDLVNKDMFTLCVVALSLYPQQESLPDASNLPFFPVKEFLNDSPSQSTSSYSSLKAKSSCTDSLFVPPPASESKLAKITGELFNNSTDADLTLIVRQLTFDESYSEDEDCCDAVSCAAAAALLSEFSVVKMKAHSVILASRCPWFKRLLHSGMKEALKGRITVHEQHPKLFVAFIEYLYTGILNRSSMNFEQLMCFLQYADKYEMNASTVRVIERALVSRLTVENALRLLSLGQQLSNAFLVNEASRVLDQHQPSLILSAVDELSQDFKPLSLEKLSSSEGTTHSSKAVASPSSFATVSFDAPPPFLGGKKSIPRFPELVGTADILQDNNDDAWSLEDSDSDDVINYMQMTRTESDERLNELLTEFRAVLGISNSDHVTTEQPITAMRATENDQSEQLEQFAVGRAHVSSPVVDSVIGKSDEDLKRILLAADYDLNRALNYVFDGSWAS